MILHDNNSVKWVGDQLGVKFCPPHIGVGVFDHLGVRTAGFVFNDYNGANIEMSMAGARALTRATIHWVVRYVFVTSGCSRLTIRTTPDNSAALLPAQRFGWQVEGYQKGYYPGDKDAVILGLQKEDLPRWVLEGIDDEISEAA